MESWARMRTLSKRPFNYIRDVKNDPTGGKTAGREEAQLQDDEQAERDLEDAQDRHMRGEHTTSKASSGSSASGGDDRPRDDKGRFASK